MSAALCSASLTARGATAVRPAASHLGFRLSRTAVIPSPARGGINSPRNPSEGFLARHGGGGVAKGRGRAERSTMDPAKVNNEFIKENWQKAQEGGTPH